MISVEAPLLRLRKMRCPRVLRRLAPATWGGGSSATCMARTILSLRVFRLVKYLHNTGPFKSTKQAPKQHKNEQRKKKSEGLTGAQNAIQGGLPRKQCRKEDGRPYPERTTSSAIDRSIDRDQHEEKGKRERNKNRMGGEHNGGPLSPKLRKPTGRCPAGMGMDWSSSGASGVKVQGGELLATRCASTNSTRNACRRDMHATMKPIARAEGRGKRPPLEGERRKSQQTNTGHAATPTHTLGDKIPTRQRYQSLSWRAGRGHRDIDGSIDRIDRSARLTLLSPHRPKHTHARETRTRTRTKEGTTGVGPRMRGGAQGVPWG